MYQPTNEDGKVIARAVYAKVQSHGTKWKSRNIPIFIREHLLIPYYLTEIDGNEALFIIQMPTHKQPKVHFARFKPSS